jgi:hypothetical protein
LAIVFVLAILIQTGEIYSRKGQLLLFLLLTVPLSACFLDRWLQAHWD